MSFPGRVTWWKDTRSIARTLGDRRKCSGRAYRRWKDAVLDAVSRSTNRNSRLRSSSRRYPFVRTSFPLLLKSALFRLKSSYWTSSDEAWKPLTSQTDAWYPGWIGLANLTLLPVYPNQSLLTTSRPCYHTTPTISASTMCPPRLDPPGRRGTWIRRILWSEFIRDLPIRS